MTPIPGCRLQLNGRPSYGWWSLDPGYDGRYLWGFLDPDDLMDLDPARLYGIGWESRVVAGFVSRWVGGAAYHSPCGATG